jgi:hypothetical protein
MPPAGEFREARIAAGRVTPGIYRRAASFHFWNETLGSRLSMIVGTPPCGSRLFNTEGATSREAASNVGYGRAARPYTRVTITLR